MRGLSGNAAITLRSRLKVKVVKDMLQRTSLQPYSQEPQQQQQQEVNGLLPHGHMNSEAGKVTLQLQVRTDKHGNKVRGVKQVRNAVCICTQMEAHVGQVLGKPISCWSVSFCLYKSAKSSSVFFFLSW